MRILIKNGYIVSMASEPFIGDILIENDKIINIGETINEVAGKVIDANNSIVMPGLINGHTHVGMSIFRGLSDDLELMDWLTKKIWPIEDNLTGDDIFKATQLSILEMIKSGTTTFNDTYFFEDEIAKATEKSGMRAILARTVINENEEATKRIIEAEKLYDEWNNEGEGRIKVCFSLHAPYTCPPDTIKRVVELSKKYNTPLHIHYLETQDEINQIKEKYNQTVTEYLDTYGLFDVPVILAHGVHTTSNDLKILNEKMRGGVVHNPISNQKLGSGIANIKLLRDNNINVGIGTDGQGSTNTLDMFEEIKSAAYLQKVTKLSATAITSKDVVSMATIEGAKVLGIDDIVGSLEVGKKADIIIIDINKPHLCPVNDVYSLIAYSVNGADVETSIIDGKIIMENRKVVTLNESDVMNSCREVAKKMKKYLD